VTIKLFLENRLNHISEQVEKIAEQITKEEDEVLEKGQIAQATFQLSQNTLRETRKLKTRIILYETIFKDIKDIK
jgi:hypothetical protein